MGLVSECEPDQYENTKNYLDPYCIQVLNATRGNFKSATEISEASNLSLTTVYRRVHILQEFGLLEVIGKIRPDGRKFFLYKSKIKELQ